MNVLQLTEYGLLRTYLGKEIYEDYKKKSFGKLKDYITIEGTLSAARVEEKWFPTFDADIFLSHSHQDEKLAIAFAGWLYKNFGLKTFVDSCVWGYCDDLLYEINGKYSYLRENDGGTVFRYSSCNNAASHVHMILNGVLAKMIDGTECLFFLNTPNSITVKQSIDKTFSPWIYSELLLSSVVENRPLKDYRKNVFSSSGYFYHMDENTDFRIEYDAATDHLYDLDEEELYEWGRGKHDHRYPWKSLNELYEQKGILMKSIL